MLRHPRLPLLALWSLTLLFALRVAAQALAPQHPALPEFAAWQGSALPYPLLLALQLGLLAGLCLFNLRAGAAGFAPRPALARTLTGFAALYASAMLARLAAGWLWDDAPRWFRLPLPALFHLVLAAWLALAASEFRPRHA